jgi:hypothetical protein
MVMVVLRNKTNTFLVVGSKRFKPYEEATVIDVNHEIRWAIEHGFLEEVGGEKNPSSSSKLEEELEKLPSKNIEDYFGKHWRALEREVKEIDDLEFLKQLRDYAVDVNKKTTKNMNPYINVLNKRIKQLELEDKS